jgi:hypothetical protein
VGHQKAARSELRRTVGNDYEPRPIVDGDSAFAELQPAHGVPVSKQNSPVKKGRGRGTRACGRSSRAASGWPAGFLPPPWTIASRGERGPGDKLRNPGDGTVVREAVGAAAATGKLDAIAVMRRVVSSSHR